MKALRQMLPENTAKVVDCFAKLTESLHDRALHVPTDAAKVILKAGLESDEESVRQKAERARENLLREYRFAFLD